MSDRATARCRDWLRRRWAVALLSLLTVALIAGCGGSAVPEAKVSSVSGTTSPTGSASQSASAEVLANLREVAMKRPGTFRPPLYSPDVLVWSQDPLTPTVLAKARSLKSAAAMVQFSMATFYAEERQVTYAAVDPATFRRFTPAPTAASQEMWDRLADGEIALRPELRDVLPLQDDFVSIGNDKGSERAHVGAYASLIDRSKIGALLNERWAAKLRMPTGNALLISTGNRAPDAVVAALRKVVGDRGTVQRLALGLGGAVDTAVLTGGSVARAVGSFTYTVNSNGTVNPDPQWVRTYIRTEQVPILGSVTCNKAMLPQLRAALREVVQRGLSSSINRSQYGGCYVPRFIARDPSQGLSFHTWGTAVDLNVPGNLRGSVGEIDRRVVEIFERWGFNWGGRWKYTDPMHFELARIVSVR